MIMMFMVISILNLPERNGNAQQPSMFWSAKQNKHIHTFKIIKTFSEIPVVLLVLFIYNLVHYDNGLNHFCTFRLSVKLI